MRTLVLPALSVGTLCLLTACPQAPTVRLPERHTIGAEQVKLLSAAQAAIDPACTGGEEWKDFVDACNTFCSEHGGWPLFNQSPRLTREQVSKAYGSRFEKFYVFQRRYDAGNRFVNSYFADILGLSLADGVKAESPAMTIR